MKYSGHRKLLCEFSKLSKCNAFNLLGYYTNTNASIIVYKFRPERTGFNMYTEYTQPQLTFLALHPWIQHSLNLQRCLFKLFKCRRRQQSIKGKKITFNRSNCDRKSQLIICNSGEYFHFPIWSLRTLPSPHSNM